ncbi:hypothetical protein Q4534_08090 [Cyclobacterium sp. 1_MG-2023]|uniref:hypothetical protein n=1 Tax=Cyclobacterium sp. 1_MG-2023 TaxID=3062681 RepID=UPI0026E3017B|nr:hypothetical protein [Cyclobacterium sp. 1_MG-2023]MDO6437360.1 hypothetical protein [Cyclobacterium sp. 1_MG-2023]
MGIVELKSNLHKVIDGIEDEKLLHAISFFLETAEKSEEGLLWKQLTEEQKKEVLQAYEESEDMSNLIDDKAIWKELK